MAVNDDLLTSLEHHWANDESTISEPSVDSVASLDMNVTGVFPPGAPQQSDAPACGGARQFRESGLGDVYAVSASVVDSYKINDRDWSMACWVRVYDTETASVSRIVTQYQTGGGTEGAWLVDFVNGSGFRFFVSEDGTNNPGSISWVYDTDFGDAIDTGTYYLLIAQHDATNDVISLSVNNGSNQTEVHANGVDPVNNVNLRFARDSGGNGGDIDLGMVSIWTRLLTDEEKSYLYNSGSGRCFNGTSWPAAAAAGGDDETGTGGQGPGAGPSLGPGQLASGGPQFLNARPFEIANHLHVTRKDTDGETKSYTIAYREVPE